MINLINKRFTIFVIIISVSVAFIAVGHWFFNDRILYFWDSFLPFDSKISFDQLYYFWQDRIFPGYAVPGWSWFLYWGIIFFPSLIFPSLSIGQFLVYALILSFSMVNFYLLVVHILKTIFKDNCNNLLINSVGLVMAFLYTFNVFTFFNFYFMFNPGAFIIAFLPINLLALIKIYSLGKDKYSKNRNLWLLVFFISIVAMSPGFSVYVFFLQYLLWIGLYIFLIWFVSKRKIVSRLTFELALFYLLVIFINLWWFFPALLNLVNAFSGQSSFGTSIWFDMGFEDVKLLNSFRLLGSGLMANNRFLWSHWYDNELFTLPLFVFPGLFIVSLIFLRKKMSILLTFLLAIVVISLFIVKFSNPPFAWILSFAFHNIPFFGGFRDSVQKAGVFFQLGYMIFISIGLVFMTSYLYKKQRKILLGLSIVIFTLGLVILSGPFFLFIRDNVKVVEFSFDGKNYQVSAKTQVPKEYYDLKNFIEDKCQGETILSVPRSGFVTNAIWEKYGTSYAGQDMLPGLVACSFLTTALFNEKSETAIQVPYLFLEQGDTKSFKQYLKQNSIKYILIRHDFVPQNMVTWTYVNPLKIERELLNDNDFSRIYENDFLSVFEKKDIKAKQYGFGLTNEVVHIPSQIENGQDYMAVSKMIGDLRTPVLLNVKESDELLEDKYSMVAISANCIGCMKINPEDVIMASDAGLLGKVKNFIKSVIGKSTNYSEDVRISINILSASSEFGNLAKIIDDEDEKRIKDSIVNYKNIWEEISRDILKYDTDKFLKNNKYIEASNFLIVEKNTVFDYLFSRVSRENKFLNKANNRELLVNLLSFQIDLLSSLLKEITQTNFNDKSYWARLDVPNDGDYVCEVSQKNQSAIVESVTLENETLEFSEFTGVEPIPLKQGSHLLNVNYALKNIINKDTSSIKTGDYVPVKLGYLDQGKYILSFTIPPGFGGRSLIVVSRGKISHGTLKTLDPFSKPSVDIKSVDDINVDSSRISNYQKVFNVDAPEIGDYYLYLYFINPGLPYVQIQNLNVDAYIDDLYFRFTCLARTKKVEDTAEIQSVMKLSPTHYSIELPNNYSGFLTFNQSFDKNWIAYDENSNELPHFESGYHNAWYIDNQKEMKITIKYKMQDEIERGGVLSVIALVVTMLVYLRIRAKT